MIVLLGALVGLVLGLTGAGGSLIAVPLLMWGLDWSLPQAAPVALFAVCFSALVGTVTGWNHAYVRYRAALLMAAAGLVAAPLGLRAAAQLPAEALVVLFAVLLVALGLKAWRQSLPAEAAATTAAGLAICQLDPHSGRIVWNARCFGAVAGIGALSGFLAGMLGIGGFVVVAALRTLSALSMHSVIATSLMATALISASTVGMAVLGGHELPWLVAMPFVLGALGGMLAGRQLARRLEGRRLQRALAVLMLAMGGGMAAHAAHLA